MSSKDTPHFSPLWALTTTRLKQFTRQPEAVFWVYLFPILMVAVLGIAFRAQPPAEQLEVAVLSGPYSDGLVAKLADVDDLKLTLLSEEESRQQLRTGKQLLLVNPSSSELDQVEYTFDPTRPGSLQAKIAFDNHLQKAIGRIDVVSSSDIKFSEPGGRYVDFLVPGLLGMSIMGGGLWGIGFGVVDMRIRKLLKRFMVTPMRKSHLLLAMIASRLVYMIPQILILFGFAWWIFTVRIYGDYMALAIISLLGALEFSGIGVLVASRAKTIETVSGLMNLVMLPMYTLCGIFFSYENFPEVLHPVIKCLPLTPLIDSLRAVMLDGASLSSQWGPIVVMSVWTVLTFLVGLWIFRWNE